MIKILADAVFDSTAFGGQPNLATGLTGLATGILFFVMLIPLGVYIYFSLAYSAVGKKANLNNPGVAWMPGMGPLAVIFETAKAHWWPFLVSVIGYIFAYPLIIKGMDEWMMSFLRGGGPSTSLILGAILMIGSLILFTIMAIVWHWKTYEAVGKPGWFAIVPTAGFVLGIILSWLIPVLGLIIMLLSFISHFVFIGIAAWGK